MNTVKFFGYGRYSNKEWVKRVIGHEPLSGQPAVIEGYNLAVQVLDQLPDDIREVMRDIWGDNFRAFTIKKGPGIVSGILWELSEEDMMRIKESEFTGKWREVISETVKTSDGNSFQAVTERVYENQPVKEITDGMDYKRILDSWGHPKLHSDELTKEDEEALERTRKYLDELKETSQQTA